MNYDQMLDYELGEYQKWYERDEEITEEYDLVCDRCGREYSSEEYYADGNEDECLDCKGHVSEIY